MANIASSTLHPSGNEDGVRAFLIDTFIIPSAIIRVCRGSWIWGVACVAQGALASWLLVPIDDSTESLCDLAFRFRISIGKSESGGAF